MSAPATVAVPPRPGKVIGLICSGHFLSHFYMLLLPPLFPILRDVYGVGFTELGLVLTAYSATTALAHAPVGFAVDRYGARAILIAGVALESLAFVAIGMFPTYFALVSLMIVAGLANAVYHPADYAILSAAVDHRRMGRAFSIHTFSGYLGAAVAPPVVVWLAGIGGWQMAVSACGAAGCVVAGLMAWHSDVLQDATGPRGADAARGPGALGGLRLLASLPILMGLLFFAGLSMTHHGVGDFGISTLDVMLGMPLAQATLLVSVFLFASPLGVLAGGWLADRTTGHDRVNVACLLVMGAAAAAVTLVDGDPLAIGVLLGLAGLANGLLAPSRDMLIRSVTPPGQTGKVFGFVSTGFNVGGMAAPVLFGWLLDNADPGLVFHAVGVLALLTLATVLATGREARRVPRSESAEAEKF